MNAIVLYRTDSARNMHRYYRLDLQRDLFGQWCVIRAWGRVGRGGQTKIAPFPTCEVAQAALDHRRRMKERRGYHMLPDLITQR
jgi:predicted DNA-binding WGR domain protein